MAGRERELVGEKRGTKRRVGERKGVSLPLQQFLYPPLN